MRIRISPLHHPASLRTLLVGVAFADRRRRRCGGCFRRQVEPAQPFVREKPVANPALDHSGRKRVGKASFYAKMFHGRKMANGKRMDPRDDNAASKTLPLGTTAKVTNLETGRSAVVTIEDRGPYVKGRIVDLSPATAQSIGITPAERPRRRRGDADRGPAAGRQREAGRCGRRDRHRCDRRAGESLSR